MAGQELGWGAPLELPSPVPEVSLHKDYVLLRTILQAMAGHIGAPVVTLRERDLTPELLRIIPAKMARMYQCLPVALEGSTLKVALADPLNVSRIDELGFVIKKDIQLWAALKS